MCQEKRRRDRKQTTNVENSLNSHLLLSRLRKLDLLVLKPTGEKKKKLGKFLHARQITVLVTDEKRGRRKLDNKSKDKESVDVPAVTLGSTETVGWLCSCRCKSLRSRLKRVDPPTPACMAALFSFPIHCHWDAIGAEYSALHTVQ